MPRKPAITGHIKPKARRKSSTSPLQRSLKQLRQEGCKVAIVEHWNQFARRRIDLFNLFDLLAVQAGITVGAIIGVQVTTMANRAAHLTKMRENEMLAAWKISGGKAHLHAWRQLGKERRWECEVTEL